MRENKIIRLLGVNINNVDVVDVIEYISESIKNKNRAVIANVNVHALNIAFENKWFKSFLNESQLVFCDGFGVHLGAVLTSQKLDHRLTPPDWVGTLCSLAVEREWSLFFLGAKPGVADLAAKILVEKHPGLVINTHHGYFNNCGEENRRVIETIDSSKAHILFVGMGMPKQEEWIKENYFKLPNVHVFLPVGAMFDYAAKNIPRGPRWMTDHGLEWLSRLFIEPKRLWKRYIIGNPVFLWRVLLQRFGLLRFLE